MLACSSGSITPASMRRTSSGDGGGPGMGSWTGAPGSSGSGVRAMVINTGYILKICPATGTVKSVNRRESEWQLAVLKALGDETRYAMYEELARSTAALSAQDLAERLGIHANTVRLHLERLREAGLVDVEAVHRGTVGRPQHLYFLECRRARARLRPARARVARRAARRPRRAGGRRRRRGGRDRPGLGPRRRPAHPVAAAASTALEGELAELGFEPALESDGADAGWHRPHRLPALPVPGAGRGLPGAGVQPAPGSVRGRRRRGRRGKSGGVLDVVRPRAVPRHGGGRIS